MQITLNDVEREMLIDLLDTHISDLRSANHHADAHHVKETLKAAEAVAKDLRTRLCAEQPSAV
jgi:hypothetical protein